MFFRSFRPKHNASTISYLLVLIVLFVFVLFLLLLFYTSVSIILLAMIYF